MHINDSAEWNAENGKCAPLKVLGRQVVIKIRICKKAGRMNRLAKILLPVLCLGTVCVAEAMQQSEYDVVTSSQSLAAKEVLDTLGSGANMAVTEEDAVIANGGANVEMYTMKQMDAMVENRIYERVVKTQDKCQFVTDIEDRARLVGVPVFQFVWGDMLINGICVRPDLELGIEYIKKSADNSYAPAMERMSFYYEKGFFVNKDLNKSERYMHTAAALGSKTGRLGWADMLIRGFGTPQHYEEAYSWLVHAHYSDPYSASKKDFLKEQLGKLLPPNVRARDLAADIEL